MTIPGSFYVPGVSSVCTALVSSQNKSMLHRQNFISFLTALYTGSRLAANCQEVPTSAVTPMLMTKVGSVAFTSFFFCTIALNLKIEMPQ